MRMQPSPGLLSHPYAHYVLFHSISPIFLHPNHGEHSKEVCAHFCYRLPNVYSGIHCYAYPENHKSGAYHTKPFSTHPANPPQRSQMKTE